MTLLGSATDANERQARARVADPPDPRPVLADTGMVTAQHPSKVSEVFSRNLQLLIAEQASVSAVCRALDINRTQFSRYLSGEAHPRPDVLARICAHFGRDARILLEPLSEIDRDHAETQPLGVDLSAFAALAGAFDHNRMPDGIYRVVMPWFNASDRVYSTLIRLFTTPTGGKAVAWTMPLFAARATGRPSSWRDRRQTGICLQHADGVSIYMASPYTRLLLTYFVAPGYRGLSNFHVGYATMTLSRTAYQAPVQPLIMEQLGSGMRRALAVRRKGNMLSWGDLTELQSSYFKAWEPGWPRT